MKEINHSIRRETIRVLCRRMDPSSLAVMPASTRFIRRWVRRAAADHEDLWRTRLDDIGGGLVIHGCPGRRTVRLEAYGPAPLLRRLHRDFGGRVETIDAAAAAARANAPRRPLLPASEIGVLDIDGCWPEERPRPRIVLHITGAMAFGTGDHATTATCLRLMQAEARRLAPGWTALDIGAGSAILAIAAEKLGAASVHAFDNDPRAVQAARSNLRRNRCRRITLAVRDLLDWAPTRRYDLVTANVFSELLRSAAPHITTALNPGACLILSGILRSQENETVSSFTTRRLVLEQTTRRGKWVTLQLRHPQS